MATFHECQDCGIEIEALRRRCRDCALRANEESRKAYLARKRGISYTLTQTVSILVMNQPVNNSTGL